MPLESTQPKTSLSAEAINDLSPIYSQTYYVSTDGNDDNDGLSWESPFLTLDKAITSCTANDDKMYRIIMGEGNFDMNKSGFPEYEGYNLTIIGSGRENTLIENTHASATGVLYFNTGFISLKHLKIQMSKTTNGLKINYGKPVLEDIRVNGEHCNVSAVTCIELCGTGYSFFCRLKDVIMEGHSGKAYVTGLKLTDVWRSKFEGLRFLFCKTAIHAVKMDLCHFWCVLIEECDTGFYIAGQNTLGNNLFRQLWLFGCTIGIQIDSGCENNTGWRVRFVDCTTNFVDNGTSTHWVLAVMSADNTERKVYPDDPGGGVTASSGAIANTYGSWVSVIPSGTISTPFRIIGAFGDNVSQTDNNLILQIASGVSKAICCTLIMKGIQGYDFYIDQVESVMLCTGTEVFCRIKSESAGPDTMDVWIKYEEW